MYPVDQRYASYKRATLYVLVYSALFFITSHVAFWSFKTLFYFLSVLLLAGVVAAVFMSLQYKIETTLNPRLWIFNIFIEIFGYYLYTRSLFHLFF
jgi:hypothetical protein